MSVKKQEAAVGTNEEEETVEQCMARVKAENPEMSDEAARAQCTKKPEPPAEAEKNLQTQIIGVMKEYGKTLADQIKTDIRTEMDKVIKETKDEMVKGIRKGLGLEKDPVLHLSEIESVVRKIVLDNKPHGKRTDTLTKEKPTDGTPEEAKKLPSAEDIHKRLLEKKGTIF